ncbi:MAG: hypothetical protein RIS29_3372, partial [Bacteroidota bacterium]
EDFLKNKNKQLDQFWVKVREINPAYENLLIKDM